MKQDIGVVVIGRNEGQRLASCLSSLAEVSCCVYVDSGSSDGSPALAKSFGRPVVELAEPPGFSAARARNAGVEYLLSQQPRLRFVQMVDGDCEVESGWLDAARTELLNDPQLAIVFGRRHERYPLASIYNMMSDADWNVPPGPARSCGGDAMFRVDAFMEAGGFSAGLVAGEEPDLCLRLRRRNWKIWSLDLPMTRHDVALTRLSQWWRRTKRTGYAFTELCFRHGEAADPSWRRLLSSSLLWSAVILGSLFVSLLALVLLQPWLLIAPLLGGLLIMTKFAVLTIRRRSQTTPWAHALAWAYLIMMAKLAQCQGIVEFVLMRLRRRPSVLIEYKKH